tara:strand:+ start:443 stop:1888 length:1446 start_codon:yes stop_codon:yes gene_type:complete
MKIMTWIASSLLLVLTACGGNTPINEVSTSEVVSNNTSSLPQTDTVSPRYKNGTNDQNRGDKTGAIRLHGSLPASQGSILHLYITEARTKTLIDSAVVDGGVFNFPNVEVSRGFYELVLNGKANNKTLIVLNPDEKEVNLKFNSTRLGANRSAVGSRENTAAFTYFQLESRSRNEIKSLRKGMRDSPYRKRIEEQIKDKELELVQSQHKMIDMYPGTYFAKYLSWKNPKYPNSQGRFFEDMDPLDNSVVHSLALSDRITEMMKRYSKGEESGFFACIDIIKSHFEPNSFTLESALYSMLDGFYNTGKEDICQYILDNFIFDEDCGADLSDVIRQRAQGIINLQVGKTPPNFNIASYEGGVINLMETVAKNKYTLVMFWASWCHKCEQEVPVLIPLYTKHHGNGFEAIGVSIDQNHSTWAKAIEDNGMNYPNVSQLLAWDSPIVKQYKITATPAYFLLDSKGVIVLKPKRVHEVESFLDLNL